MIASIRGRIRPTNIDGVLDRIIPIIDKSNIAPTLTGWAQPKSAAGAPRKYGSYTVRGVLIAMFQIAYAERPMSVAELFKTIWFDYTDAQLAKIGMGDLRTPQRIHAIATNERAERAEYQRLWDFIKTMFAPIDDTPMPANRRHTKDEAKTARAAASLNLKDQTDRRRTLVNDLIAATIDPTILDGWRGDIAIDEHVVNTATNSYQYFADTSRSKHGGAPMASWYPKQNRVGKGWHVGLTRIISTSRPYENRVPTLCLAIDVQQATAGNVAAALNCIDAMTERNLRPNKGHKDRQYLITDMGYSRSTGFNVNALKRGYTLLMNLPKNERHFRDLGPAADPTGTDSGPYLFKSAILCPGAHRLTQQTILNPPGDDADLVTLRAFAKQEAAIAARTMPLNGHPKIEVLRPAGRPKAGAAPAPTVIKLQVQCPAAAGKIRCPLLGQDHYTDPTKQHLPEIGTDAPFDHPPKVCRSQYTTLTLTPEQYRQYQPLMAGSWEHADWMASNRSRDEGFNAYLTRSEGGHLQDRSVYARRNPNITITIALGVATANLKAQDAWHTAIRRNNGQIPKEARAHIKARRDNLLAAA